MPQIPRTSGECNNIAQLRGARRYYKSRTQTLHALLLPCSAPVTLLRPSSRPTSLPHNSITSHPSSIPMTAMTAWRGLKPPSHHFPLSPSQFQSDDALVSNTSSSLEPTCLPVDALEPMRIPRSHSWTDRVLGIPEIVLLIQEHLDRSSLCVSLRISRLWYHTGQHVVWKTVDWDNTLENSTQESMMLLHSHRIRTLRCMFHSQAGTSNVDSSSLLRSFVDSQLSVQSLDGSLITMQSPNNDHDHNGRLSSNTSHRWPVLRKRLHHLYLKGHFDLQSIAMCSGPFPTYVSFSIPTLTRLDIRPSVSSAVDIHLILDSATRLEHLVIHSHGSFVNSQHAEQTEGSATTATAHYAGATHYFLLSLTIQHLKIGREELEGVAARCPNLIEFQSVCSPGALWKARPQQQQQSNQVAEHQSAALTEPRSLARTLAESCSSVERFHIGLQQGGFHLDSIRETLTSFPRLQSLGLPAWDCTKVTMDAIKTIQLDSALTKMSLTSLCIMNVCSSEKVSQAIHDYLCWTPYLKEFYAYNTTLYVDQMQQTRDIAVRENHAPLRTRLPNFTKDHQNIPETGLPPMSGESHTPTDDPPSVSVTPLTRQWACTHLERLVVRFAHLPWRNLADPPKRSKDTFAFLRSLQNLKHLCIKEGLVLEAGREYDVLEDLKGLEEVVFTTCYPIPIKPVDMMWTIRGCDTNHGQGDAVDTAVEKGNLKKVVVRRQKVNAALDKEMNDWFREHRPDLKFSFERTDCCEEEYSFHQ